jgi:hypothetical protein
MSGRKRPEDDISGPVDLLRMLLQSLENELPRALELRERLHMSPEPSQGEHATSGLVAEALGTRSVESVARTGLLARLGPPGRPSRCGPGSTPCPSTRRRAPEATTSTWPPSRHCFGPQDESKDLYHVML